MLTSGNIRAIYKRSFVVPTISTTGGGSGTYSEELDLSETPIYGSKRIGDLDHHVPLWAITFSLAGYNTNGTLIISGASPVNLMPPLLYTRVLRFKNYELTDHLKNVLMTVSDRKISPAGTPLGPVPYFIADVMTSSDYYPFGEIISSRNTAADNYRFAYNGKEKEDELYGDANAYDYGMRMYDARIARFMSVDPLIYKYPMLTPYQFASNSPIQAVDLDGLEARVYTDVTFPGHCFLSVLDNNNVLHVYTYGQYGQGNNGKQRPYGTGALVHLQGKAANAYLNYEFNHNEIHAFEVNKKYVDKDKVMNYYNTIHNDWSSPAEHETSGGTNAVSYIGMGSHSWADQYSYYFFMPIPFTDQNNCVTVAAAGMAAGGYDELNGQFKPQGICATFLMLSTDPRYSNTVKDVTEEAKNEADGDNNSDNNDYQYLYNNAFNLYGNTAPSNYVTIPSDNSNTNYNSNSSSGNGSNSNTGNNSNNSNSSNSNTGNN